MSVMHAHVIVKKCRCMCQCLWLCVFKMTHGVVILTNRMAYGALLFGNHK